jgi:hypothetical protein
MLRQSNLHLLSQTLQKQRRLDASRPQGVQKTAAVNMILL